MTERRWKLPLVIAVVVGTALVWFLFDLSQAVEEQETETETTHAIWRCNACARVEGKSWTSCKTVTGRGTEEAVRELVAKRVCSEALNRDECHITRMKCQTLSEESLGISP